MISDNTVSRINLAGRFDAKRPSMVKVRIAPNSRASKLLAIAFPVIDIAIQHAQA